MSNVGGEQVIHLVGQGGLQHQLGEGRGVPDSSVEKGWAAHPVHNLAKGEGSQQFLKNE